MGEMKEMEGFSQPFQIEELKQKHLKVLDVPQKKNINGLPTCYKMMTEALYC